MRLGQDLHPLYGDRYFSDGDALAESIHVFVEGNGLCKRLASHTGHFHIAETGFGTGLNLLALVYALRYRLTCPIVWWSCESHPLSTGAIRQMLDAFDQIRPLRDQLCDALDQAAIIEKRGWVEIELRFANPEKPLTMVGPILLRVFIGDVLDYLEEMRRRFVGPFSASVQGGVDAWVLDGHSPVKNPDMWSSLVFAGMAALSSVENTTFATYTAAGIVKQGLRRVGFSVTRTPGFGRKRHMIQGSYVGNQEPVRN